MVDTKRETYWSKFARTYDDDVNYVVGKAVREEMAKRLGEERDLGDVVEFGCGNGYFTKIVAHNARTVMATDLSDEMLEIARERIIGLKNVMVQKADCEEPPFPDRSFDTVLMVNVIHVVEDPLKALKESRRILKDGGLLIIVNNTDHGINLINKIRFYLRFFRKFGIPPLYYRVYSPEALRALVEGAGYRVETLDVMEGEIIALYLKARK